MSEMLAGTARWTAAQRARESARPDRLFNDPLAVILAGPEGAEMLRLSEQENPQSKQAEEYLAVRTRYFDDFITRSANEQRKQIVLIAAGMDSRAFRLPLSSATAFYELDQPALLDLKQDLLNKNNFHSPIRRTPVPANFQQDWLSALDQAGFQAEIPSVWLVEGLLYYLEEAHVRQLLQNISSRAASGSALGADLASASFFRSPWTQKALEVMRSRGIPWLSGSDNPEALFAEHGWQVQVTQPGEESANYGRWTSPVVPRDQKEVPHTFLVNALKT